MQKNKENIDNSHENTKCKSLPLKVEELNKILIDRQGSEK